MKKTLYLIGGTMGVGKTTTCRQLQQKLPDCVFLDGDWCWDMHPFTVNAETKKMVVENIAFLLNQF
ncbi:MAG: AAA family ATPase, partial [Clostridia bacterium]|nr:AAA family ATPase [Clostridia bacterium]